MLNVQSPNTELKFLIKINIFDLIIFQDFRLTWVNYSQKLTESFHKFLTSEILCNVTLWVHKSSEVGQPKTTSHEASSCNSIKAHQVSKIEVLKIKFYWLTTELTLLFHHFTYQCQSFLALNRNSAKTQYVCCAILFLCKVPLFKVNCFSQDLSKFERIGRYLAAKELKPDTQL